MTSNLLSCLSNSKTCHRVWLLRLIRLKINIVLMATWEVIRISSNITTSCRLSNRLNWSLCRIKLCKRIHNTKAKCQTRLSLCNTLTCICSRTQALRYNKQIKVSFLARNERLLSVCFKIGAKTSSIMTSSPIPNINNNNLNKLKRHRTKYSILKLYTQTTMVSLRHKAKIP